MGTFSLVFLVTVCHYCKPLRFNIFKHLKNKFAYKNIADLLYKLPSIVKFVNYPLISFLAFSPGYTLNLIFLIL